MLGLIKLYFTSLIVFLALDAVWLGFIAKDFYKQNIGFLMTDQIRWSPAIIFYLIFVVGLLVFVLLPLNENTSIYSVIAKGAFFGFVTYATYDLTNFATLKDFPLKVVIVDLAWGTFITAMVSLIVFLLKQSFPKFFQM